MSKILKSQHKNMGNSMDIKKQWVNEKMIEKATIAVKNASDYKQLTRVVFSPKFQAIFR